MSADPETIPLDDVRNAIRYDLAEYVATAGGWTDPDAATVAHLAAAYVTLGGDLELAPKVNAEAARLEGELEALEPVLAAARDVLLATEGISADEFPPRLEHLVDPLNRLANVVAPILGATR